MARTLGDDEQRRDAIAVRHSQCLTGMDEKSKPVRQHV